ncbi:hypothetical protein CH63R_02792 [Colletotrichum higginsianum IMI 349063]|uniref:Uncharacterized protein n=1 Tax=Colletotrichum higginsianum (strain IMI 349063) TaxID=759273 RepID=A0A1B7YPU2_COLHI|nr:hypothetical protein CH63R_02792 [Colletotrichum higginsianum IMI 349063]OBR14066.1 hypothetical protein CH63R_02792 [Colletotrichum higginsianum IMI 349063]
MMLDEKYVCDPVGIPIAIQIRRRFVSVSLSRKRYAIPDCRCRPGTALDCVYEIPRLTLEYRVSCKQKNAMASKATVTFT